MTQTSPCLTLVGITFIHDKMSSSYHHSLQLLRYILVERGQANTIVHRGLAIIKQLSQQNAACVHVMVNGVSAIIATAWFVLPLARPLPVTAVVSINLGFRAARQC